MIAPDVTKELTLAAYDALKWFGKAIADDAFAGCCNPKSALSSFDRLDRAVKAAKSSEAWASAQGRAA